MGENVFKSEEKTIGDFTYKVTQLDGLSARKAVLKLTKIIGPAFDSLRSAAAQGDAAGAFTSGLKALTENLSEEDFEHFCDLFAARTEVSGPSMAKSPKLSAIFAAHFTGDRLPDMFEWLIFAMKVNFQSFFNRAVEVLKDMQAKAEAAAKAESNSPTASTGSSGDS